LTKVKKAAKSLFTKSLNSNKKTNSKINKNRIPLTLSVGASNSDFLPDMCQSQESIDFAQETILETKIFGRISEVLQKKGFKAYEWSTKPDLNTIKLLDYFEENPKLNPIIEECDTPIEFFNFFFNDEMFEYLVLHSNEKLLKEKLRKPSNFRFVF
jgi:hypothetical protein